MRERRLDITLFGNLEIRNGSATIDRFQTLKTAELLAYLAHNPNQKHARLDLIERLWDETDLESGRNRLRIALTALRHQLEPTPEAAGTILIADRSTVHLNTEIVHTDTVLFAQHLAQAARSTDLTEQTDALTRAVELCTADFLTAYDAEWILEERTRLAACCLDALHQLTHLLVGQHNFSRAIGYARRILNADSFREETHYDLMRLYVAVGQPTAALRQYRELEALLLRELNAQPAPAIRQYAEKLIRTLGHDAGEVQAAEPEIATASLVSTTIASAPSSARTTCRLPMQHTRFFGRGGEIERLAALFLPNAEVSANANARSGAEARVVTLTGPGGIGKTRLAIEAAAQLKSTFTGGIWFVALANIASSRLIPEAIADALELPYTAQISAFDQIVAFLAGRNALLCLDNLEHLASEAEPVLSALLEHCPSLALLITSRRILGLAEEIDFALAPLPLPQSALTNPELLQNECVRLFVDRARRVRADFELTPRNAGDIAALCRELEGLPLALELAAARSRILTPPQIRKQLSDRLDILTDQSLEKNQRHRSLRATIEWSYRLLTSDQRAFFASLSVFRGGWSLESVTAIAGASTNDDSNANPTSDEQPLPDIQRTQPPDLTSSTQVARSDSSIASLIPNSASKSGDDPMEKAGDRPPSLSPSVYSLLHYREPIDVLDSLERLRRDSLIMTTEENETIRFRMLETLREFADEQLSLPERAALRRRHAAHFRTLALDTRSELTGPRQLEAMQRLLAEQNNLRAALAWHFQAREKDETIFAGSKDDSNAEIGIAGSGIAVNDANGGLRMALALGIFWVTLGLQTEAREWLTLALHYARKDAAYADALYLAGLLASGQGDYEQAKAWLNEAIPLAEKMDSAPCLAAVHLQLGNVLMHQHDCTGADEYYLQALHYARQGDDNLLIAKIYNGQGVVCRIRGELDRARALFTNALQRIASVGDRRHAAYSLFNLASTARDQGDIAGAIELIEASMVESRAVGDLWQECYYLLNRGLLDEMGGQVVEAAARYKQALRLAQQFGDKMMIAHALWNLSTLSWNARDYARYTPMISAATRIYKQLGMFDSESQRELDEKNSPARASLSDATFELLWLRGQTFTPLESVHFAAETAL